MDWLIAIQRWLYGGMAEGMRSAADMTGLPALMSLAFLFGIVHALMPGHGKTVLVSYHLGRDARWHEGLMTGTLLALTHIGTAVVLVLAGVAVISRSVAAGGRAPAFELTSAVLITLIGAYLVARLLRPHSHARRGDGRALAVATGLVPCPLTTFILTYALARGKLAIGLAAVLGMMLGVIVTLASFAVSAVLARERMATVLARSERFRSSVGWGFEMVGALAVTGVGIAMLMGQIGQM
jgi:ABC-type nickel/cobalt efflux system permease component RcnA